MSRFRMLVCLLALAGLVPAAPSYSQQPPRSVAPPEGNVTVALVDDPGAGADVHTVILRQTGSSGDVILLRRGAASGGQLAVALSMLINAADTGAAPPGPARIVIRGSVSPRNVPEGWLTRSNALLARLRAAPERTLPGVGRGRAETVPVAWLRPVGAPSSAARPSRRRGRQSGDGNQGGPSGTRAVPPPRATATPASLSTNLLLSYPLFSFDAASFHAHSGGNSPSVFPHNAFT